MIRNIALAAVGALLALSVGAAAAYFTTQIQVADSIITAGTVAVSSEPTTAPLAIDALAPGVGTVKSMALVNTGTLPLDVTMTASKKAGYTDFYNAIECTATCGSTQLYAGTLAGLRTAPLRLGRDARADVRFELGLPASAGNDFIGDYAKVSLYVDGEQAH